ncbi:MAG: AI-2E family transporter [Lachnospiraceae bacterium]|jgi:Predicted permease|nr:AI-2E family transporter [Lachnospiraceae bacterium]
MKFKINNKYFRWGLTAFLVIAASMVFYYFMFHHSSIKSGINMITDILMPIMIGLVVAYLLTPVLNFIEDKVLIPLCNKCGIKESSKRNSIIRGFGIMVTAFLFISLIYLLFAMLLSQIIPSIQNIVVNFDSYTDNFIKWLDKLLVDNPEVGEYVVRSVGKYSEELEKWINDFTKISPLIRTVSLSVINLLGVLWDSIIGFIISIYVLASKEKFAGQAKKIVYAIFERDTANVVIRNFRFTHSTFIGFISGKILDSIIIGILCFIGTSILHTPYAALVSVIIGVTNVIPFFGPYLGAIPCGILVFIVDPIHPLNCVYFLIFILGLQQFDGNILGPKILGSSTGLTGFWVISSISLFGGFFGVLGMIIGVPIFAVIYAAIRSLVNTSLKKKNMPDETKKYENLDFVDDKGFHECTPEKVSSKHKHSTFEIQTAPEETCTKKTDSTTKHED